MVLQILCATIELALYAALALASVHLVRGALWALRRGPLAPTTPITITEAPLVTVQLPIRNERASVEALLRSVRALTWPNLEVQVLDDSDDETSAIIDRLAPPFTVLRRSDRRGYKAGNLAHGLRHAKGSLLLVLDADSQPPPDLIEQLHDALGDDAFVQARWTFRNVDSTLTRLQRGILDALFTVEQAALSERRAPVQFNGTAGLWRREALERAGGWLPDERSLTEDLDLSLRAHALGLTGRTLPAITVSTELPSDMSSFVDQQARWVRGGGLTLRALGRNESTRAFLGHLVRHARQPLFVAAMVRLAIVAWGLATPATALGVPLFVLVTISAGLYLGAGRVRAGGRFLDGAMLAPSLLSLSAGLAPRLSTAFVGGVLGRRGDGFVRTPKAGDRRELSRARYGALDLIVIASLVLATIGFVRTRDVVGALVSLALVRSLLWVNS